MLRRIDLNINIDSEGNGRAKISPFRGKLYLVKLPKRLEQTEIRIYPSTIPDLMFKVSEKQRNLFRIKMDSTDLEGNLVQQMSDLPIVDDMLMIDVYGATPEFDFPVILIYEDGKNGSEI